MFDEFRYEREREASDVANGALVSSCPAATTSTFVGLPSEKLRDAVRACKHRPHDGNFRLALDETGTVTRIITMPQQLIDVPCVMATACGLRFAGLGAVLTLF